MIERLTCCVVGKFWHIPSLEAKEFTTVTRRITFSPGVGLPGRVWASAKPAWIVNVVHDANFPRAPVAAKTGLHAAFGFPILAGNDVIGIIEFFSHKIREPDEPLLNMMSAIGSQIGQFIKRKEAEIQIVKLSRAVEQSPNTIVITDNKGNIEYVNPKGNQLTGYTPEEVIGKNPRIFKTGETPQEEYKRLWAVIKSGGEWRGEFRNKKKNGECYWESASISSIKDSRRSLPTSLRLRKILPSAKGPRHILTTWLIMTLLPISLTAAGSGKSWKTGLHRWNDMNPLEHCYLLTWTTSNILMIPLVTRKGMKSS